MTHRPVFKGAQYDQIPAIQVELLTDAEGPQALSGLDTVRFLMWPADGSATVIDADATVVDPGVPQATPAIVSYAFEEEDVENAGTFLAQFVVHWATGGTTRYPRPEPMRIELASSRPEA